MLTSQGHAVTLVSNGGLALDATRGGTGFDLILMDLQMPVMDGLTATAAIRREEASRHARRTPIIGLTANAMLDDVDRCAEVGMDAHVAKPIEWPKLFAEMDRLLAAPALAPQSDALILDEATLASLSRIVGRDRLAAMLARFVTDVRRRLDLLNGASPADVAAQAHSLAAIAGQLGFKRLSELCRKVEDEMRESGSLAGVADLREAADRAARAATACEFARVA